MKRWQEDAISVAILAGIVGAGFVAGRMTAQPVTAEYASAPRQYSRPALEIIDNTVTLRNLTLYPGSRLYGPFWAKSADGTFVGGKNAVIINNAGPDGMSAELAEIGRELML